jgi:zinc transport system substrate-binding protein
VRSPVPTRIRQRVRAVAVMIILVPALAACTSSSSGSSGGVRVVASFYPLAEAAQQVGGSFVSVDNLTAPGVEPHDLELTPQQIEAIDTADVVLYLGGGFQPAVEDAIRDAAGTVIDASASLRSLPVPPGETDASLSADPHVWLDPTLYRQIVEEVRAALAQADPAHAQAFGSNAKAYNRRLAQVDRAYRSGLADCQRALIVTSHAAFAYLSARYGLTQEPISGLSPDAEPTPRHLAEIQALVEREGVTTIFTEELVSPKVAETLASETGTTTAVLNPLESLSPDEAAAGADYVSVMQGNLTTLRAALGCT